MADEIKGIDSLITASKQISLAVAALNQTVSRVFPNASTTSPTAIAGAATLPANPVGFLNVNDPVTGATIKIPYYS